MALACCFAQWGEGFMCISAFDPVSLAEQSMYFFLQLFTGIEIMLARSPMVTGFCFGRAENLENYFSFARMASEEFDPNTYFKKVSCLVLVEVIF